MTPNSLEKTLKLFTCFISVCKVGYYLVYFFIPAKTNTNTNTLKWRDKSLSNVGSPRTDLFSHFLYRENKDKICKFWCIDKNYKVFTKTNLEKIYFFIDEACSMGLSAQRLKNANCKVNLYWMFPFFLKCCFYAKIFKWTFTFLHRLSIFL